VLKYAVRKLNEKEEIVRNAARPAESPVSSFIMRKNRCGRTKLQKNMVNYQKVLAFL
jgi:hypothetical protein